MSPLFQETLLGRMRAVCHRLQAAIRGNQDPRTVLYLDADVNNVLMEATRYIEEAEAALQTREAALQTRLVELVEVRDAILAFMASDRGADHAIFLLGQTVAVIGTVMRAVSPVVEDKSPQQLDSLGLSENVIVGTDREG